MNSLVFVGIDVHSNSFSLACYVPDWDVFYYEETIGANVPEVIKYADRVSALNPNAKLQFGYESGSLGYTLYRKMKNAA